VEGTPESVFAWRTLVFFIMLQQFGLCNHGIGEYFAYSGDMCLFFLFCDKAISFYPGTCRSLRQPRNAVAEKVSALRTEEYFQERGRRANRAETLRILERAGKGNPPVEGDELPREGQKKPRRKGVNGRDSASKRGQKKRAADR
jgi:hypothetical protein